MGDFLDFLAISDEEVFEGTYYKRKPLTPTERGEPFRYDIVNDSDRAYAKLLDNMKTERTMLTIKTNDNCGFKIKGYIATQDGELWQINSFIKKLNKPENKQALRIIKETIETEWIIRLIQVDNPWGLK